MPVSTSISNAIYILCSLISFLVVLWIWIRFKLKRSCFLEFVMCCPSRYVNDQATDEVRLPPAEMRKVPPASLPNALRNLRKVEVYPVTTQNVPLLNVSGGVAKKPLMKRLFAKATPDISNAAAGDMSIYADLEAGKPSGMLDSQAEMLFIMDKSSEPIDIGSKMTYEFDFENTE